MNKNEISFEGLPKEIKEKIYTILDKDHIATKPVTIEKILPELDVTQEQREQLLKVLSPEFKQEAKNHERLEKIMAKNRSKPNINKSLETIRQALDEKRKRRD